MHLPHALCLLPLLSLLSLFLFSPCSGQEATSFPHPIFEHWKNVFAVQYTAEGLFAQEREDVLPAAEREDRCEEIASEVARAQERAAAAQEAAQRLYQARLELLLEFMNAPCSRDERGNKPDLQAACREWLAEGFRRDLEALLPEGQVEPGTCPGRMEELFCPVCNRIAYSLADGCQAEISMRHEELTDEWRGMQDRFMARLRARYGEGEDVAERDPFSGSLWCRKDEETARFCEGMQGIIDREQQAWQQYLSAMCEMVAPCPSYHGSGTGIAQIAYERDLLDTRERFLCLLAAGADGMAHWPQLTPERHAPFQPLHPLHRFDESFTANATLFRHPRLPGNPWCLRFEGYGAGFIFVQENHALREFAEKHPEGGKAEVFGYQTLQCRGPLAMMEGGTYTPDAPPPAMDHVLHPDYFHHKLNPQPFFCMLRCKTEDKQGE